MRPSARGYWPSGGGELEPIAKNEAMRAGDCLDCRHARAIRHPHGGLPYYLCGYASLDPAYPKYPRLPVQNCPAFVSGREDS